jgi:hypothetical protein
MSDIGSKRGAAAGDPERASIIMLLDGEYKQEKTPPWYEFLGGARSRSQLKKRLFLFVLILLFAALKFTGIIRF